MEEEKKEEEEENSGSLTYRMVSIINNSTLCCDLEIPRSECSPCPHTQR
jgi:hypothetical protein